MNIITFDELKAMLNPAAPANLDKNIVLNIFSDSCGACKDIEGEWTKLPEKYPTVNFFKIRFDPALLAVVPSEKIKGLPTFAFFRNAEVVHVQSGAFIERIEDAIKVYLLRN
jgi:thiol-disulfide isomerase/thioredoxin